MPRNAQLFLISLGIVLTLAFMVSIAQSREQTLLPASQTWTTTSDMCPQEDDCSIDYSDGRWIVTRLDPDEH